MEKEDTIQKMKITHITTVDNSGAGRAAVRIVRALQDSCSVSLLCLYKRYQSDELIVKYLPLKASLLTRLLRKIRVDISTEAKIRKILSKYRIIDGYTQFASDFRVENDMQIKTADIIHLHWISFFVDIERLFASTNQPIIWTLHDMGGFTGLCNYSMMNDEHDCTLFEKQCGNCPILSSNKQSDYSNKQWKKRNQLYQKNLQRLHIVTCSNWLADCARRSSLLRDADIRVIPNCIDVEVYKPLPKIHRDNVIRFMLGAVNAKDPNKGYERLQRMVNCYAVQTQKRIEVLVVGQNSDDLCFQENVLVRSFGFIESDSELAAIYNQADLLLYGSYRDNLPNMIMEAMACGVPVIAFPVGGVPDMIIHEETGYLASTEEDYVRGIQWCLNNKEELGLASRNKVINDYHPNRIANMYNQLYQEVNR